MFGTLGGPELFLIFVVALIVFGPRKLPDIGKSLGKMMSEFRRASNDFRSTIETEVESEKIRDSMRVEPPKVKKVEAGSPPMDPGAGSTSPDGEEEESDAEPEAPSSSDAEASPGDTSGSPEPTPEGPESESPKPSAEATGSVESVPTTVSRQPPPASESGSK